MSEQDKKLEIKNCLRKIGRKSNPNYLNAILAFLVSLMAAVGGVTVTKLFEHPQWSDWIIFGISLLALLVLFLVTFLVEQFHYHSKQKWGTAYYLGFLIVGMRDEHRSSFKELMTGEKYKDYRALTGNLSTNKPEGFDWSDEVALLVSRMQDSVNQDDVSTGFVIVPNLLMPVAVSFGSQVFFPQDIELVEMPEKAGDVAVPFQKWPRWELGDLTKRAKMLSVKDEPKFEINETYHLELSNQVVSKQVQDLFATERQKLSDSGVILIALQNVNQDKKPLDLSEKFDIMYRFAVFPRLVDGSSDESEQKNAVSGFDQIRVISDDDPEDQLYKSHTDQAGKQIANVRGLELFDICMAMLLAADQLHQSFDVKEPPPVVLCARLPKSMAVALGQALDSLRIGQRQRNSLWQHMIVLNWELGPNYTDNWRIARVHPAQPSLQEQLRILERHGYTPPS